MLKFVTLNCGKEVTFFSLTEFCKSVIYTLTFLSFTVILSLYLECSKFLLFSLRLTNTHTHTQVHSMLVFILASFFVFYLFLYSLQLSSHTVTAAMLPNWLFHLSYCLNTPFFSSFFSSLLLSHFSPSSFLSLSVSFLVSVFHSPHPSLTLYLSVVLSHSASLSLSSPAAPPSPSSFPLTLSLSLFIFLSSLPSLTQSLSISLIPQFPSFLSLPSFTCFLKHPFSLTHSFTLFFCLFLPSSVLLL